MQAAAIGAGIQIAGGAMQINSKEKAKLEAAGIEAGMRSVGLSTCHFSFSFIFHQFVTSPFVKLTNFSTSRECWERK